MRVIGAVLAVAALVLSPLYASGSARADAAQAGYVNQLQAHGTPGTSDQLLANGYVMCHALDANHQPSWANVAANSAGSSGRSFVETAYEVGAAIRWLCPAQGWQIQELAQAVQAPEVRAVRSGYAGG
ncbi:DUF732 domain-containing protein [Mycobacterium sp. 050272]|uniref:DUF732 domain-containing protein n=1 Tax=Mycobacterium sp. 050272 TaxID=3142488 RepID=UPI00319A0580